MKHQQITRLYGLSGDESMHADPTDVLQQWHDDHDDDDVVPSHVEEWDVHSPEYHMPSAESILEWITEWAADNGELCEDGGEWYDDAIAAPEAVIAANALLAIIGVNVHGRTARTKLRDIPVERRADDYYLNNEPAGVTL